MSREKCTTHYQYADRSDHTRIRLVSPGYCMYVVVISGMTSTPPSALCGNVRSTKLGEVRRNRFGPLLARSRHCSKRDRLHHRRYPLIENPYATNAIDTTANATSCVTQETCTLQNGDSHPVIDKQSIHAFHTADLAPVPRRKINPT